LYNNRNATNAFSALTSRQECQNASYKQQTHGSHAAQAPWGAGTSQECGAAQGHSVHLDHGMHGSAAVPRAVE
jgi:hypothetical protein